MKKLLQSIDLAILFVDQNYSPKMIEYSLGIIRNFSLVFTNVSIDLFMKKPISVDKLLTLINHFGKFNNLESLMIQQNYLSNLREMNCSVFNDSLLVVREIDGVKDLLYPYCMDDSVQEFLRTFYENNYRNIEAVKSVIQAIEHNNINNQYFKDIIQYSLYENDFISGSVSWHFYSLKSMVLQFDNSDSLLLSLL